MGESAPSPSGIIGSLNRLLSSTLAVVQNRLELFFVEFREEQVHFFELLLLAGLVILLAAMTLSVITVAVVVLCLRAGRFDLLVALIVFYLTVTGLAFWRLRQRLTAWEPFTATLSELKKDQACLAEKE